MVVLDCVLAGQPESLAVGKFIGPNAGVAFHIIVEFVQRFLDRMEFVNFQFHSIEIKFNSLEGAKTCGVNGGARGDGESPNLHTRP